MRRIGSANSFPQKSQIVPGVRKLKFRAVDSKNMIAMPSFPPVDHFVVSTNGKSKKLFEQGREDPLPGFGKSLFRNLIGKVDLGRLIADPEEILVHGTTVGVE